MTQLKDGEPCGHPGCLHHVTHPCEGCGRVAGRRPTVKRERKWEKEHHAIFYEEFNKSYQLRELAEHYHDVTDEFDLALCPRTAGFPEISEERRVCIENARRTSEELYGYLCPLGVSDVQWTEAIRSAAQRTRGRCRD